MKTKALRSFAGVVSIAVVALAVQAGCVAGEAVVPIGRLTDSSVSGSVTYRERIALTSGARLVVELRDVSHQDAASKLIASKTIEDPGQVPIEFELGYERADIDPRSVYSIRATIYEVDGRMAFTNDMAYEVITQENPDSVDMVLVLVQPPPEMVKEEDPDWRSWIEVPATVTGAEFLQGEQLPTLRVTYLQSTVEDCARRGTEAHEVVGDEIRVTVTLMERPVTGWSPPCYEEVVELDATQVLETGLDVGKTYRVVVNGDEVMSFEHQ